jgi:hypothetical protein
MHGIGNFDNRKSSQKIVDNEINGYVRDEWRFDFSGLSFKANSGISFRHRTVLLIPALLELI